VSPDRVAMFVPEVTRASPWREPRAMRTHAPGPSRKESPVLITILIILAIIALVLFIWRNFAGRRV
jgi:hypothetical protein